jgi:AcrR family transcriptional regulator
MPRQRSERARNNDDAIRSAAIDLLLSSGLDAISFRDVGKSAGLTHGALYARFEDVEELLVDLWSALLSRRVISLFESAMFAASNPSEESVSAVLQRVRDAERSDVAAVQVLLLSRRFLVLREEVELFIHDYLDAKPQDVDDATWSRALVLFSLTLVKIFSNSEFGINQERLNFLQPVLSSTLSSEPEAVPTIAYAQPDEWVHGAPHLDLQSRLAFNTYGAVGVSGYTNATISRISRRAECSPGAIYKMFPAKEDLVIFASRRMEARQELLPLRLAYILEEGVLAQALYEAASSQNNLRKYFYMEMMLASAHNSKLRDAVGAQLQGIEKASEAVTGISDEERTHLRFTIREVTLLTLGVAFLSTLTSATSEIDFAQFSEPFRIALLECCFPSWPEISRQLRALTPS